nr:MAG: RNA-dependent RNA polymerase [Mononegavirales sp.]
MKKTNKRNMFHESKSPDQEEGFSQSVPELSSLTDPFATLEGTRSERPESRDYINNRDYSLNSPLISDEVDNLHDFLGGSRFPGTKVGEDWTFWRSVFLEEGIILGPKWSSRYHSWWGRKNQLRPTEFPGITDLLFKTNRDLIVTGEVVKSFMRAWQKKDISVRTKAVSAPWVLLQGELFLLFHRITLWMNSRNTKERTELTSVLPLKLMEREKMWFAVGEEPLLGEITVTGHHLYIWSDNLMLDLNMILMVKDTAVARWNTYLTMIDRFDRRYNQHCLTRLRDFYRLGDLTLKNGGNQSFTDLKLIEPICVLRMSQLASEARPLIPIPPNFPNFMLREIEDRNPSPFFNLSQHILREENIDMILVYFGSFRHFGHPFLNYLEGLDQLYRQVTMRKDIDIGYSEILASDLAFKVLRTQYRQTKRWALDRTRLAEIPLLLRSHVINETWPPETVIRTFGDHWNELPLAQCFEIPDLVDPSLIYSDKSHSINRCELVKHISTSPDRRIPTRRVITTFVSKPATDWKLFLEEVNDNSLPKDDLVIGLRGKEREMKLNGRFFALMSWRLREYFVMTEYLIKRYFVPLFSSLTMSDDQSEVLKKMLQSTSHQGIDGYSKVSVSNHLDYEKWNNHQRAEATDPVFRVMGKFLGYPNLIARTHEFFKRSLIYYVGREDLLTVRNGEVVNKTGSRVCWDGQEGGLEGLRQKGWSILNLLMIEREKKIRNTKVTVLAQGDNQVITTHYKPEIVPGMDDEAIRGSMETIMSNNQVIMEAVRYGAQRLGLRIKEEETLQSSDLHIFGKVVFFRRAVLGLETKRTSRITCSTNDQIPSLATVMASSTTNILTVSHYDTSPIDPILMLNFFGNFTRLLIEEHNPALRKAMKSVLPNPNLLDKASYKWATLFLDPSLGGVCGCSLTRFLMRLFPDPLTESLSFWRQIYCNTSDDELRNFCIQVGNPKLKSYTEADFSKLLESPTSLNLAHSVSAQTILREEVRKHMYQQGPKFKNEIIREATIYSQKNTDTLTRFLGTVQPCFPRFLSEFKSSTYLGIAESLVGLYQNSRTIRNLFSRYMRSELDAKVIFGEKSALLALTRYKDTSAGHIWKCSATKADDLRRLSWRRNLVGTTVPHPFEMINLVHHIPENCPQDLDGISATDYVTVHLPGGMTEYRCKRGPLPVYLGSKTAESTDIMKPWEKETNIPLLRRAAKLREVISWFVPPETRLARSILGNLRSLTGEDWEEDLKGFARSGSALHRFYCQRVSPGGYAAVNPSKLSRMYSTTDTMSSIGSDNYDFMFQSLILYSQITSGEIHDGEEGVSIDHYHVSCKTCLRKIEDVQLEADFVYNPPDVSRKIRKWIPKDHEDAPVQVKPQLMRGDWMLVPYFEKCRIIGVVQGFLVSEMSLFFREEAVDPGIFPLSLQNKLWGDQYFTGLIEGMARSAGLNLIQRRSPGVMREPYSDLMGVVFHLIGEIAKNPGFCNLCRKGSLKETIMSVSHSIPPQYPMREDSVRHFLAAFVHDKWPRLRKILKGNSQKITWLFSDLLVKGVMAPFIVSGEVLSYCVKPEWSASDRKKIRSLKEMALSLRSTTEPILPPDKYVRRVRQTGYQLRASISEGLTLDNQERRSLKWGKEITGVVFSDVVSLDEIEPQIPPKSFFSPPRLQCPLISGLRLAQLATGAHYKVRSLLGHHAITCQNALIGGDGSGGISSMVLRVYPTSYVLFSSLVDFSSVDLRGCSPGPPSAIDALGSDKNRCLNLSSAWAEPSDLRQEVTWKVFSKQKITYGLDIDLIILDPDLPNSDDLRIVVRNYMNYHDKILEGGGTFILKLYGDQLAENAEEILSPFSQRFREVSLNQTQFTSSFSNEMYLVCLGKRRRKLHQGFVNWFKVEDFLSNCLATKSTEDELTRAQILYRTDRYQGVPLSLVPSLSLEIQELLGRYNIPPSIGMEVGEGATSGEVPWNVIVKGLLALISSRYLKVGKEEENENPPSLSKVGNVGAFVASVLYIQAIKDSDTELVRTANRLVGENFPFHWKRYKTTGSGKIVGWNLRGEGLNKGVFLTSKMALIGKWMRAFSRLLKVTCAAREGEPQGGYRTLGIGLDVSNVLYRSGWSEMRDNNISMRPARAAIFSNNENEFPEAIRD